MTIGWCIVFTDMSTVTVVTASAAAFPPLRSWRSARMGKPSATSPRSRTPKRRAAVRVRARPQAASPSISASCAVGWREHVRTPLTFSPALSQPSLFRASTARCLPSAAASTSCAISGRGTPTCSPQRHINISADSSRCCRSRDVAAGGQGAPLVPAFHLAQFASTHGQCLPQHATHPAHLFVRH